MNQSNQDFKTGSAGYYETQRYNIQPDILSSISNEIVNRVNSFFGEQKISSVGVDITSQIFETIRSNWKHKVVEYGETNVMDQLKERVVSIITQDAISYYAQQEGNKTRSIWNTVGIQRPDNLRAVNTSVNLLNPTILSDGNPRF